ncbi:NUDIX hydrolase [Brachybacterium sp. JHP9]|uniref:NUDIX hydrolase n=1 Tax=Brachybacterium equifaecis TaxID=2910770 RepID=A0ABT0R0R8_9MICO|nr:NUDIX hydrolase [Brachybacterium equifaecis]
MSTSQPTAAAGSAAAQVAALRDEPSPRPVSAHRRAYSGMIWDVIRDTVDFAPGVQFDREYIAHTGAVAVLAVREDGNGDRRRAQILLIRQYRHPLQRAFWEIPAGLLDQEGEDPADAAARELAEETGLAAGSIEHLITTAPSPGSSQEEIRIHLARDLREAEGVDFEREDEEAEIEIRWVPCEEILEAIGRGALTSGTLLTAVLAYLQLG